jgi:hypothetical protein
VVGAIERYIDGVVAKKEAMIKYLLARNGITLDSNIIADIIATLNRHDAEVYSEKEQGNIFADENIILKVKGVEVDRVTIQFTGFVNGGRI